MKEKLKLLIIFVIHRESILCNVIRNIFKSIKLTELNLNNLEQKKGYKQYEKMCAFSFKLNSEINLQLKYYRILYNIFMYFYKDS